MGITITDIFYYLQFVKLPTKIFVSATYKKTITQNSGIQ